MRAAGGYLVQLLPGAGEDVISRIEENIRDIKPASTMIDEGMTPGQIIDTVMGRPVAGGARDTYGRLHMHLFQGARRARACQPWP